MLKFRYRKEIILKRILQVYLIVIFAIAAIFSNLNIGICVEQSLLQRYKLFLEALDKGDKESIPKALDEFIASFKDANEKEAADAHRLFRKFYSQTASQIERKALQDNPSFIRFLSDLNQFGHENIFEMRVSGFMRVYDDLTKSALRTNNKEVMDEIEELYACGLDVGEREGFPSLIESQTFLKRAASIPKGDYGDYAKYMAKEGEDHIFGEMWTLQIGWESLRGRIINMDDFIRKHPDLPETKSVIKPLLKKCIDGYLCGIGYSFAYAPENGAIDPELRESYELFINENSGSSYHLLVKRVYEAWKKNDFKKSDELVSLLAMEGYDFLNWDL